MIADSEVAPDRIERVENHGARPEVLAARRGLVGFGARESATVLEPFVYVARRVGDEAAPARLRPPRDQPERARRLEEPFRQTLLQISLFAGLMVAVVVTFIRQRHARELERVRAGVADAAAGPPPRAAGRRLGGDAGGLPRPRPLRAPRLRRARGEREGAAPRAHRLRAGPRRPPRRRPLARAPRREPGRARALPRPPRARRAPPSSTSSGIRTRSASSRRGVAEAPPTPRPSSAVLRFGGELTPEQVLEITVRSVPAPRRPRRAGRDRRRPRRHGARAHGDDEAPVRVGRLARAPHADRRHPRGRRDARRRGRAPGRPRPPARHPRAPVLRDGGPRLGPHRPLSDRVGRRDAPARADPGEGAPDVASSGTSRPPPTRAASRSSSRRRTASPSPATAGASRRSSGTSWTTR